MDLLIVRVEIVAHRESCEERGGHLWRLTDYHGHPYLRCERCPARDWMDEVNNTSAAMEAR